MRPLNSALYSGWLKHRRHQPKAHSFRYRMSMLWLDLDEQEQVFSLSSLWSGRWWSPMRFRQSDYLKQHARSDEPLPATARRLVTEHLGIQVDGPVRLLTQVRSFGLLFNPVSLFYCHDRQNRLQAIIAEVSNTPWHERFCYVMRANPDQPIQHLELAKAFHVSPFLPLDLTYRMHFNLPAERLLVHMEDWQGQQRLFDATLNMHRQPLSARLLRQQTLTFPFMVIKTLASIYWQALRLALKRIPIFDHQPAAQHIVAAASPPAQEQSDENIQASNERKLLHRS